MGVRDAATKALSPVKSTTIGKTAMPKVRVADVSFKNRAAIREGRDERTFECAQCAYGETIMVKFR